MNNKLTILNGRTLGDFGGAYTSIQTIGCSVIDYFAVSNLIEQSVNSMTVLDFNQFSDHKPLSLEISCNHLSLKAQTPISTYENAPTRYIFDENPKENFIEIQQGNDSVEILRE